MDSSSSEQLDPIHRASVDLGYPIGPYTTLTDALHRRWVMLLRSLPEDDFKRGFRHPEGGELTVDWTLGYFAWHSRHHAAHILNLRKREGW